jgi:hypothetical protein
MSSFETTTSRHRRRPRLAAVAAAATGLALALVAASPAAPAWAAPGHHARERDRGPDVVQGFLLRHGRFTALDRRRGTDDAPNSIDNRGRIVGFSVDEEGTAHGYLYEHGRYRTIDPPQASAAGTSTFFRFPGSYPSRINDEGTVVGAYTDEQGLLHGYVREHGRYRTVDYPGAVQTTIDGINNDGDLVGYYLDDQGIVHGFLRERGRFRTIDHPGTTFSGLVDINDRDEMVGGYIDARGFAHGFAVDRRGHMTEIEAPGGQVELIASDIDNRGRILGYFAEQVGDTFPVHGFLLTPARGHDRFRLIDAPGDRVRTETTGLNDRGDIVGFGDDGRMPVTAMSTMPAMSTAAEDG